MKIFICINLFLMTLACQAQPILQDSILKKGYYLNFAEFKANNPRPKPTFTVKEDYQGFTYPENMPRHTVYIINFDTIISRKIESNIMGFSDGMNVYVFSHENLGQRYYVKVYYLGKYSYFNIVREEDKGLLLTSGGFSSGQSKYLYDMILDIQDGSIKTLTKEVMESILKNDPELFAKYKKDTKRKKHSYDYIKAYCERQEKNKK
jgi:hypothetical protein